MIDKLEIIAVFAISVSVLYWILIFKRGKQKEKK